jgi:hypothetical protein
MMARIRTIKPEFPHSESMGRVSRDARLCFIMLWTIADDEGRLRGNSRMLASLLFPYDDDAKKHMDGWLEQLSSEGCIARYEVDGTSYIQVMNWRSHQKIDKPSASKIPPFNEHSRKFAKVREASSLDLDQDQGRDQGGEGRGSVCTEPQSDSLPPALVSLPLVDKTEFAITEQMVSEWSHTYPAVDVLQQLREMRQWCIANPTNRKTRRGIGAFVIRWLGKEQDKPQGRPGSVGESFRERDQRLARERWEEATGRRTTTSNIIDITPSASFLEIQQ